MTLQQLSAVKRWHIHHHRQGSVEYQVWDSMLTCWMLGWMGLPPAVLLAPGWAVVPCVALFFAPSLYVALRRRLHSRGVLRCDWLDSTRSS
ncbi:MAG: hypothetical protein CFE45_09930 [Burkholderiales bacterium PBB5]|nr:MAG: hypothetical protein CFE45_09930 [Burkholderiales bacterium PBB5]